MPAFDANSDRVRALRDRMLNPYLMRGFMAAKLPLALFAGLRITQMDARSCEASLRYGWRNTNPFRSVYFAALAMAAELSTGALAIAMVQASPQPVSMLITHMEADFTKKATGRIRFRCEQGEQLAAAIQRTVETGAPEQVDAETVGLNDAGQEVARFVFRWSFKRKG